MVDLNECLLPAGYFRNVGIAADGDFAGMTASDFYNNNDTGAPMTNTAGDELCDNPHIDGQEGECVDSSQPWIEIPIYSQGSYTMETTNVSIDAHGCLCAPGWEDSQTCGVDTDECGSNPCVHASKCVESATPCVDNVTALREIIQGALQQNGATTPPEVTSAADCNGVIAALGSLDLASLWQSDSGSWALLATPDCFTALPNGQTIADSCPVVCQMCDVDAKYPGGTVSGVHYPNTPVDAYSCHCLPGWGDHNCDQWVAASQTTVVTSYLHTLPAFTTVAGVPFTTSIQYELNQTESGQTIGSELSTESPGTAMPGDLFQITANNMVSNSSQTIYAGNGMYNLTLEIHAHGVQLVFIFSDALDTSVLIAGSPFELLVKPNVTYMANAEFLGSGAHTARHGTLCDDNDVPVYSNTSCVQEGNTSSSCACFDGNQLFIRARDFYNNPRPKGADFFGISASILENDVIVAEGHQFHADSPSATHAEGADVRFLAQGPSGMQQDNTYAPQDGQYEVVYWWQESSYDQVLTVCHRGSNDEHQADLLPPNEQVDQVGAEACAGHQFGGTDIEIAHYALAGDLVHGTIAVTTETVNQTRLMDVYVIPSHFWGNNGPGVFEPVYSPINGNSIVEAGHTFVLNISTVDEFEDALDDEIVLSDYMVQDTGTWHDLFELHSPHAMADTWTGPGTEEGTWNITYLEDGIYQATTVFYRSQCDECADYALHVLGQEMSGLGFVALLNSPHDLHVDPGPISFENSYCVGHGCDIARHGTPSSNNTVGFEGNAMSIFARDQYQNTRPVGADPMWVNFLSSSASMEVEVKADGEYAVTYWWTVATFEQGIYICPNTAATDGNDADLYKDWHESTEHCNVNATVLCPESPEELVDQINSDLAGDFVDRNISSDDVDTNSCDAIVSHIGTWFDDIACDATAGSGSSLVTVRDLCPLACGSCAGSEQSGDSTMTANLATFQQLGNQVGMVLEVYVVPQSFHVFSGSNEFDVGQSQVHPPTQTIVAGTNYDITINALTGTGSAYTLDIGPLDETDDPPSDYPGVLSGNAAFKVSADDLFDTSVVSTGDGNGVYVATIVINLVGHLIVLPDGTVGFSEKVCFIMSSFGTDPERPESTLLDGAPWSVTVIPASLDAAASYLSGPGTVMAQEGEVTEVEGGNIIYIHSRDEFGNARIGGDDLFSMDPLYGSAFDATVIYLGGTLEECGWEHLELGVFPSSCQDSSQCDMLPGANCTLDSAGKPIGDQATYLLRFWWTAQYAQGYEVCARREQPAGTNSWSPSNGWSPTETAYEWPHGWGACGEATEEHRDQVVQFKQIFMRPNEGSPYTDPTMSDCVCLNNLNDPSACSMMSGTAGVLSSFTIEAKNDFEFPNYRGNDYYEARVEGPVGNPSSQPIEINVEYVRINFYEVSYTPILAGHYNIDICLCKDGPSCGCLDMADDDSSTPLAMYGGEAGAEDECVTEFQTPTTDVWSNTCLQQFCPAQLGAPVQNSAYGQALYVEEVFTAPTDTPYSTLNPSLWVPYADFDADGNVEIAKNPILVAPNVPSPNSTEMTLPDGSFVAGEPYRLVVNFQDQYGNVRGCPQLAAIVSLTAVNGSGATCDADIALPQPCDDVQSSGSACQCTAHLTQSTDAQGSAIMGEYYVDLVRTMAGNYTLSVGVMSDQDGDSEYGNDWGITGTYVISRQQYAVYDDVVGSPVQLQLLPGGLNITNTRLLNLDPMSDGFHAPAAWGVEDGGESVTGPPEDRQGLVQLEVAASLTLIFQAVDDYFNPIEESPTVEFTFVEIETVYEWAINPTPPMPCGTGTAAQCSLEGGGPGAQTTGGQYEGVIRPTIVGAYHFSFTVTDPLSANEWVIGPFNLIFVPGPAAIGQSTVQGTGLVSSVAGTTASFDITLFDEFGNQRESADQIRVEMVPELNPDLALQAETFSFWNTAYSDFTNDDPRPVCAQPSSEDPCTPPTDSYGWIENVYLWPACGTDSESCAPGSSETGSESDCAIAVSEGTACHPIEGLYRANYYTEYSDWFDIYVYINEELFVETSVDLDNVTFNVSFTAVYVGPAPLNRPTVEGFGTVWLEGSELYPTAAVQAMDIETFYVQLLDTFGNRILTDDGSIEVSIYDEDADIVASTPAGDTLYNPITYDVDGRYKVQLQLETAQLYTIKIKVSHVDFPVDSYPCSQGDSRPSECYSALTFPLTGFSDDTCFDGDGNNIVDVPDQCPVYNYETGLRYRVQPGFPYGPNCRAIPSNGMEAGSPNLFEITLYDQWNNLNEGEYDPEVQDMLFDVVLVGGFAGAPTYFGTYVWDNNTDVTSVMGYDVSVVALKAGNYDLTMSIIMGEAASTQTVFSCTSSQCTETASPFGVTVGASTVSVEHSTISGLGVVRTEPWESADFDTCVPEPGTQLDPDTEESCPDAYSELLVRLQDRYENRVGTLDLPELQQYFSLTLKGYPPIYLCTSTEASDDAYPDCTDAEEGSVVGGSTYATDYAGVEMPCTFGEPEWTNADGDDPDTWSPNPAWIDMGGASTEWTGEETNWMMRTVVGDSDGDIFIQYRLAYAPGMDPIVADPSSDPDDAEVGNYLGAICQQEYFNVSYADNLRVFLLHVDFCDFGTGNSTHPENPELCGPVAGEAKNPYRLRVGPYEPPEHRPYMVDMFGSAADLVIPDPIIVMANMDKTVYFQNVYRNGAISCSECNCAPDTDYDGPLVCSEDGDGLTSTNDACSCVLSSTGEPCTSCDVLVDLNTMLQIEPGFGAPVFEATAYDRENEDAIVEFVQDVEDPWFTLTNNNPLVWGRYTAVLAIRMAGEFRIDLSLDQDAFATFNMSIRPELAAASVTQVIASAVSLPGSVEDFDTNTTEGAAALNQFQSGVADLFGIDSSNIVIVNIGGLGPPGGLGRRLQDGAGYVSIQYTLKLETSSHAAARLQNAVQTPGFADLLADKLASGDTQHLLPEVTQIDTAAQGVQIIGLGSVRIGVPSSLVVRLTDKFNNARATGFESVDVKATVGRAQLLSLRYNETTRDYRVEYVARSCDAGDIHLMPMVNGLPVRPMSQPFVLLCEAGDIDGRRSLPAIRTRASSVAASGHLYAGESEIIHVKTLDTNGMPITRAGEKAKFVVTVTSPNGSICHSDCDVVISDVGSGTYAVSYTTRSIGVYKISIGIRNVDETVSQIQHSPFTSVCSAGQVHPANCEVTTPDVSAVVGSAATIMVVPRDIYGNLISDVGTKFTAVGKGVKVYSSLDSSDRPLQLGVSSLSSGPVKIQVYHTDLSGAMQAAGQPVTITYLPGSVSLEKSSIVSGYQSVSKCVTGKETTVVVALCDERGNPTSNAVATDIILTLQQCYSQTRSVSETTTLDHCEVTVGPLVHGSATVSGDKLSLTYVAPQTGNYKLRITYRGREVKMPGLVSPAVVRSDVAAVAAACVASGDGIERATSATMTSFHVQANGIFENNVQGKSSDGDTFDVAIIQGANLLRSQQRYIGSGQYEISYTAAATQHSEEQWPVSLSVRLGGEEIQGSPFQLKMVAGVQSGINLVARGSGITAATAGSKAVFEVTAGDFNGNIIHTCATHMVSATLALKGMETVPEFLHCSQGIYRFQYTVAYAGTYQLHLELDGAKGDSSTSMVTVQSSVISSTSTLIAADASGIANTIVTAVAGDSANVFIHARDQFKNALTMPICTDGSTKCMQVQFRWCHAETSTQALSPSVSKTCTEIQPTAPHTKVQNVGIGLYHVTAKLMRAGTYAVHASYLDEKGTLLPLARSDLTLSVSAPRRSYVISKSTCEGESCLCKPGYERDGSADALTAGDISCALCPTGMYKDEFSNTQQCQTCPTTTSTAAGIADSVDSCQCEAGLYDFRSTFIECVEDDWAGDLSPQLKGETQCIPCPSCVQCFGDGAMHLREGYWAFPAIDRHYPHSYFNSLGEVSPADELSVITAYRCETPGTCTGGAIDGGSGCVEGAEGPTCASCKVGYTRTEKGCESCASVYAESTVNMDAQDTLLLVALVAFAAFLGFVMIKQAKAEDVLKLKILIGFGQVIQSFSSTYNVRWPANLRTFIDMFAVFSFDLFSMGNTECSMPWSRSFYGRFVATVLTPIGLVALIWLLWKVQLMKSHRRRKRAGATSPLEHKIGDIEISGQWASRAFFILVLTYLQVSSTIMDVFKCRQFEPTPGSSVRVVLEADMSIQCNEGQYMTLKMAAIVGVFLYPIGVPVFFVLLLWRERKHIHDSVNQKKYGFLFGDYMAVYFLWEVWDLGRKLMLSGLLMFFKRGSVSQLLVAMVIALFALELQLRLMPYKSFMANVIQLAAFNAILLNLVGAMLLKVDDSASVDGLGATFADGFLVLINLTVPVLVLLTLLYSMSHDLYLYSVGRFVRSDMMERSRQAVMDAISRQQKLKCTMSSSQADRFVLPSTSQDPQEMMQSDLSDEATLVAQLENDSQRMSAQLATAKLALEQKREWLRFVRNHTATNAEFLEMCQTESPQSYRRLLGVKAQEQEDKSRNVEVPNPVAKSVINV
jgi:hypothetical protein